MDPVKGSKYCISAAEVNRGDSVKLSGKTILKNPVKANFKWTVGAFSACPGPTESVRSPEFSHRQFSKWCVELENTDGDTKMCFCLVESRNSQPVEASLRASMIGPRGTKRQAYWPKYCTLQVGESSPQQCVTNMFKGDVWTFECEVITVEVETEDTSCPYRRGFFELAESLKPMMESKEYADFTLNAGGVQFRVHRAILSARCPVFGAMLRYDTKESQDGCVEVPEDPAVLLELLRYIYTDVVVLPSDKTEKLLVAFDKYSLPDAKSQCEYELMRLLTVENAAATAAYALVSSSVFLQKVCFAFIKLHLEQVVGTKGWADIIDQYPVAAKAISEAVAKRSERSHPPAATTGPRLDAATRNSAAAESLSQYRGPVTRAGSSDTVYDSCYTCCEKKKVIYQWTVSDLSNWPQGRAYISSPSFCHPESVRWELRLYKNPDSGYVACFHLLKNKAGWKIKVDVRFEELRPRKGKNSTRKDCVFEEGSLSQDFFPCGFFVEVGEEFMIECEMTMVCRVHHRAGAIELALESTFKEDLQSLHESGNFGDIVLCAGTVEFKAHKVILAARSPVFARILREESEMVKNGRLEIPDIKPQVLERLLYYMYVDRCDFAWREASVELVMASHRFDLHYMQIESEYWLSKKLTPSSAVTAAIFALEKHRKLLLEWAVKFISSKFEEVKQTDEWKEATVKQPKAVQGIHILVAQYRRIFGHAATSFNPRDPIFQQYTCMQSSEESQMPPSFTETLMPRLETDDLNTTPTMDGKFAAYLNSLCRSNVKKRKWDDSDDSDHSNHSDPDDDIGW